MLHWLPSIDVAAELAALDALGDADAKAAALLRLANARLSFLDLKRVDDARRGLRDVLANRLERVRVALLGSATLDHLAPAIRVAGLRRGLLIDVHVGGFGQYRQELASSAPALRAFAPHFVLLSLSAADFISAIPIDASAREAEAAVATAAGDIQHLWEQVRDLGAVTIQQSLLDISVPVFGSFDTVASGGARRLTSRLNVALTDAAAGGGALWLDLSLRGPDSWFDVVRWHQAKIEISPQAGELYADLLARLIAAQRGRSSKCLVLDLDGTLWGGVLGDDGPEGIVLGAGSGVGEAHLALQLYAKRLRERGVMLAVCSKNEPGLVEAVLRDHPEMALKRGDFAAVVANWNDKAANLRDIAASLNIGLDALVFVDDNPVERARIRQALPMVAVPELPRDPALFVRCVADAGYFESVAFTSDDAARAERYGAQQQRAMVLQELGGVDAFLEQLDMVAVFGPITPLSLARAVQLINKTNQFNFNAIRRTDAEVGALCADGAAITLQCRLIDKFGDNGIVAVMLLAPAHDEPDCLAVETWVMSCRVFGRELEHECLKFAVEQAATCGARGLRLDVVRTEKNGVALSALADLGFAPGERGDRWRIDLADYQPHATKIARKDADA